MRKSWLGYLGFLGLLGLLANKAARNSFIASLFLFIIATIYANIAENLMVYAYCFVLGFALQIVIFSFSLQYYDQVGE